MNELKEILRELPSKVSYNVAIRALRKAAYPIEYQARAKAPRRKGVIQSAITIVNSKESEPAVLVAPTAGKQAVNDAWYAKFQEFGTKGFGKRRRISAGAKVNFKTGKVYYRKVTTGYRKKGSGLPALHFMQKALEEKRDMAINQLSTELSKIVVPYLRKKAPKYYAS